MTMFRPSAIAYLLSAIVLLLAGCRTDRTAPTVVSTYPANGAVAVPLAIHPQVMFSEAMDQSATEAAFQLAPNAAGSFSWSNNNLMLTPDFPLAANTQYTMTIGTGAKDLAGNLLSSEVQAGFTTGDSTSAGLVEVWMMGRSVMSGWFTHWGSDPVYVHNRFTLRHWIVESPPDIVASVQAVVDSVTMCQTPVMLFKLCFVDFEGGDSATAQANLDRNLGYVTQVDSIVEARGLKLILGNALPQVASSTDPWLVWNHRQYNQRLNDFATAHPDVHIFDLYSVLSNANGELKPEYATSSSDSHPNDAGYTALDAPFFAFLNQYY
jgi:hypothetical protein